MVGAGIGMKLPGARWAPPGWIGGKERGVDNEKGADEEKVVGVEKRRFEVHGSEPDEEDGMSGFLQRRTLIGILVKVKLELEGDVLREEMVVGGRHTIHMPDTVVSVGTAKFEILLNTPNKKEIRYFASEPREFHAWLDALRLSCTAKFTQYYVLGALLGQGKYGRVYECTCKRTRRKMAVKIVPKRDDNVEIRVDVNAELEIVKTIYHPHLVRTYETFESVRNVFIVMELLKGGECVQLLQERGRLPERDAAKIMRQLFSAISFLHSHGIVHRDVKLENVLIADKEKLTVRVTDFGLSTIVGGRLPEDDPRNDESCLVGTYLYMAPEILRRKEYGKCGDIWACGVVLHLLLSKMFPFESDTEVGRIKKLLKGELDLNSGPWTTVSEEAKDLISRLLRVDGKQRPSAREALMHPWIQQSTSTSRNRLALASVSETAPEPYAKPSVKLADVQVSTLAVDLPPSLSRTYVGGDMSSKRSRRGVRQQKGVNRRTLSETSMTSLSSCMSSKETNSRDAVGVLQVWFPSKTEPYSTIDSGHSRSQDGSP